MDGKRIFFFWASIAGAIAGGVAFSPDAIAGSIELSAGFSYSRSNFNDQDYSWTRRLGGSIGFNLSEQTQIELSFQDIVDRTKIEFFEDTVFHDRIYSANWVQALTGRSTPIQPYFKLGIGQLNRDATGVYQGGLTRPPTQVDSLTGILGAGMRVFFTRQLALRVEGTSYLTGGNIGSWRENFSVNFGLSFVF